MANVLLWLRIAWAMMALWTACLLTVNAVAYARPLQQRQQRRNPTRSERSTIRDFLRKHRRNTREPPEHHRPADAVEQMDEELAEAVKEFRVTGDYALVVHMGDLYARGRYPAWRPNEHLALLCYGTAAACPDGEVAGLAQAKYVETRITPLDASDIAGRALPEDPPRVLCEFARERIRGTPFGNYRTPLPSRVQKVKPQSANAGAEFRRPPARNVRTDGQNVHDHGVMTSLRQAVDTLRKRADQKNNNTTSRSTADLLEVLERHPRSADAVRVLRRVEASKDLPPHSALGITEAEALDLVLANADDNVLEILVEQLASGVEEGSVVCSSGRIGRILGSMDGQRGGGEPIKPMWAVKDELANLAIKLRDAPDAKNAFVKEATRVYVRELGMSEDVVSPLIATYADALEA